MNVAIVGSRTINPSDEDFDKLGLSFDDAVVSGGARGVDRAAAKWARAKGLKLIEFIPLYEIYGKAAPHKRNEKIFSYCDVVIAFWDGKSKGTASMIARAKKAGKKCLVIRMEGDGK